MARKNSDAFENLVLVVGKAPWWVGVGLAAVSYFVLHAVASGPIVPTTINPGQMGEAATKGLITAIAIFAQYVFPFAFTLGAIISAITSIRKKRLYAKAARRSDVSVLNEMGWEDFEQLVGEYFRKSGYKVSRTGGNGPDGGVDLVLKKDNETYLVQCKQWKAYKVGVQPVREFYGVMTARGAVGGFFVSSGEYTAEAQAFVRGLNLELLDGRKLKEMIDAARWSPEESVAVSETGKLVVPYCPKCGKQMKKRVARQGANAGKEFWGCVAFPNCNGIRTEQ